MQDNLPKHTEDYTFRSKMIQGETKTISISENLRGFVRCREFGMYLFLVAVQLFLFFYVAHHRIESIFHSGTRRINEIFVTILIYLCVAGAPLVQKRMTLSQPSLQETQQKEEARRKIKACDKVSLNKKAKLQSDKKKPNASTQTRMKNIAMNHKNKLKLTGSSNTPARILRNSHITGSTLNHALRESPERSFAR
mmetsp:Transcript_12269/g.18816  ORF Transcript_12269/g.18816 Transcript_12269/m.18816 type:complete len:195 (-) Transcript_12269:19-603(-)